MSGTGFAMLIIFKQKFRGTLFSATIGQQKQQDNNDIKASTKYFNQNYWQVSSKGLGSYLVSINLSSVKVL